MTAVEAERRIAELEAEVAELGRALKAGRGAAESAMRGIADALPVMISYIDADLRYRFANKAYEDWFGVPLDRIIERPVRELVAADTFAERLPYFQRALAGERVRYEATFPHAGGVRQSLVDHIPHVHKGQVRGFYALVQDVTEQWRALQVATESEARFRRVADSAPIPMWVTKPDRTREFANRAYVDFLGVSYDEALRFDWRTILHEEDHERIVRESVAGEASGERFTLEARYRRADGEWRWIRSVSQPRFDAAGMPEGFIGVADDITETKRAAEAARLHAADLSARVDRRTRERDRLWDLSRDLISICDRNGVYRSVSPSWTTVLGWSADRLIGRNSDWLVHPDDAEALDELRGKVRHEDKPITNFINRMRAADGEYRCLSWSIAPEGDSLYCVARDITAEREQAAALHHAEEALRQGQKMEALGQLTGGVAHDFNNLLTPIMGALDLVARRLPEGDRTLRMVEAALQSADRARTLVQRLLAFARRQPLDRQPVALGPLVEGMHRLLQSTLGPRIEVTVEVAPDLPAALGDANQIELALLNLAVNARDAMPEGGRLTVTLAERDLASAEGDLAAGRYVALTVRDTGEGMDADTLRRATEPFFSTKAKGAGTGLGLSMVHGLAGQLGGALSIESEPGRGTAIELLLPATEAAASAATPEGEAASNEPMRVLLVDDDALVRFTTARMLIDQGHHVIECGSGAEALAALDEGLTPDLLVCDQVMPQMSGTQVIAAVRERLPGTGLLMISGYPLGDDRRSPGLQRLPKPFTAAELARAAAAARPVRPARAA